MNTPEVLENLFRWSNEKNVHDKSVDVSVNSVSKITRRSLMSRLLQFFVTLPISGAMFTLALTQDYGGWEWVLIVISVIAVLASIGSIYFFVVAITGYSTIGSILHHKATTEYYGAIRGAQELKDIGDDVSQLEKKLTDDYDHYINGIKDTINIEKPFDDDNIYHPKEEFETSVKDISSLVYLRAVSQEVSQHFEETGVDKFKKILRDNDDDTVRLYIEDNVSEELAESLDLKVVRETFARMDALEEITKFRMEDPLIPDKS